MSCSSTVGKMETGNNFMSLRCIVYFGSPNTKGWHTGVSAAEFGDGKCRRDWGSWGGSVWRRDREPGSALLCLLGGWETLGRSWRRRGSEFPSGISPWGQSGTGAGDPEAVWLHPGGGESTPTRLAQSLQQSGLTLLLWAGDWHRDILNSLPTWVFLWSNDLLYYSQTIHIRKHIIILPNLFKFYFI